MDSRAPLPAVKGGDPSIGPDVDAVVTEYLGKHHRDGHERALVSRFEDYVRS